MEGIPRSRGRHFWLSGKQMGSSAEDQAGGLSSVLSHGRPSPHSGANLRRQARSLDILVGKMHATHRSCAVTLACFTQPRLSGRFGSTNWRCRYNNLDKSSRDIINET